VNPKVVVGLRNPGSEYEGSRHNLGAEVVVELVRRHGLRLKRSSLRVRCEVADGRIHAHRAILAMPLSFMNQSGGPVSSLLRYHKAPVEEMLVLHDDIDLGFGRLRLQAGGGTGGHNGLRSLERVLGTREFSRLKMGVGRPPGSMDPAAFVLRRFAKAERPEVDLLVQEAADVVELWLDDAARAQEKAAHRRPS
jgi:PTH1 family peptidyl-tRNA hydrolase